MILEAMDGTDCPIGSTILMGFQKVDPVTSPCASAEITLCLHYPQAWPSDLQPATAFTSEES